MVYRFFRLFYSAHHYSITAVIARHFLAARQFPLFAQSAFASLSRRLAAEANATSVLIAREHLRFWEMRSRQNYFR
jgi:hypothetical protein